MSNCVKCMIVQEHNPGLTAWELSEAGSFEAVMTVNGTDYCKAHGISAFKATDSPKASKSSGEHKTLRELAPTAPTAIKESGE